MIQHDYVLTIDQGTSSTKVILYDFEGKTKAESTRFIQFVEHEDNFIEQKPFDILQSIQDAIKDIIDYSGIEPKEISAVAIDNQGETIIPFRKNDLTPLYNAISWQDNRGEEKIKQLKKDKPLNRYIENKTGLLASSYFSAAKMEWLVKNVREIREEMEDNNLMMATSEVWLINKLIQSKKFKTDFTTASRTMLFDLQGLKWDDKILSFFQLNMDCMPTLASSISDYGITDPSKCHGVTAPILVSVVDQQAALVGHRCFREGQAKLTLGTGGFLQVNSGKDPENRSRLIIKSILPEIFDKTSYLYEGQIYSVGSAIEWLRRNEILKDYSELKQINTSPLISSPYFIPALSGVSAPYWRGGPLAAFIGMGLQTTRLDLVGSVMEAIAFSVVQSIELIQKETDITIKSLSVDGRVNQFDSILKTIAGLTGMKIIQSKNEDLTSLGCLFLAGSKLGVFENFKDIRDVKIDSIVYNEPLNKTVSARFIQWRRLFDKVIDMA
ncbi:FGGY family carbohydrate kinase [Desulfomarina sp.]